MSKRKETVSILSLNSVVFSMGRCIIREEEGDHVFIPLWNVWNRITYVCNDVWLKETNLMITGLISKFNYEYIPNIVSTNSFLITPTKVKS
jgi:hypothetical protein